MRIWETAQLETVLALYDPDVEHMDEPPRNRRLTIMVKKFLEQFFSSQECRREGEGTESRQKPKNEEKAKESLDPAQMAKG